LPPIQDLLRPLPPEGSEFARERHHDLHLQFLQYLRSHNCYEPYEFVVKVKEAPSKSLAEPSPTFIVHFLGS
jgi:hypothetical protein